MKSPVVKSQTLPGKPKAAKAQGKYTMEVELEYKGQKASAKVDLHIE